jgi:hypothetical protein
LSPALGSPPPLGPSPALIVVSLFAAISPAHVQIQLRHRLFRFSSIPSARGRPLLGRSPTLIVVSVSMPPLRFFCEESSALIHSEKRRGQLNIYFAKWILPPSQIFTPFDLYKSRLTFRLIQTICENVKIIMIYLKYIL